VRTENEEYKKTREDYRIFFLEYGYQKKRGRVLIVEEMESAESGNIFGQKILIISSIFFNRPRLLKQPILQLGSGKTGY
tara:strand:+ start:541 stop:777 length:237 start_codon:yes stop_codon:yes gene_type:complete